MTIAVILAAGTSQRFGSDKCFELLGSKPIWRWSYDSFFDHPEIHAVGIVTRPDRLSDVSNSAEGAAFVVSGGETRSDSVREAIHQVGDNAKYLLIHDAARPFVTRQVISDVIRGCSEAGAAYPAIVPVDTIRRNNEILPREDLGAAQTPQGARVDWLRESYANFSGSAPDDVAVLAHSGHASLPVPGSPENFKITHPSDLTRAEFFLGREEFRIGQGYDIHRFSDDPSRPCIIGGTRFHECRGLMGHSDADVLLHAIADALFGAAGMPDIGFHFPNTDPRWLSVESSVFLNHAKCLLEREQWRIVNIDSTVLAEEPKIMTRRDEIRQNIARALGVDVGCIGVKATTHEGLGALGRCEGVAAMAVATVARRTGGQ